MAHQPRPMAYRPRVELDRRVHDRLVLRSIPGAVDYLVEELRTPRPGVSVRVLHREPDRLTVEYDGPLRPLAAIRYFSTCAVALDEPYDDGLARSRDGGVLAALAPEGDDPVRFRVGDIGPDRWVLRDRLEQGYGWLNSPRSWDVNIERDGAEIGALFVTQRHGDLLHTPASTNPVAAAVMVRLAKIEPGQAVLDPCCGAGTLLVMAGEVTRPGLLLGVDVQRRWLSMAGENMRTRGLLPGRGAALATRPAVGLVRADAARLPIDTGTLDRVVANLPFGKRVGSHRVNAELYPAMLREIARALRSGGRAVLLTDDKRLLRESVQRTPLIRVIKEIMLARGGLHPSVYVLSKRGANREHHSERSGHPARRSRTRRPE
jgi:tRNA (guanine6-N2)-methyltransferase